MSWPLRANIWTDGRPSLAPAAAGCRAFVTLLLIFCGSLDIKDPLECLIRPRSAILSFCSVFGSSPSRPRRRGGRSRNAPVRGYRLTASQAELHRGQGQRSLRLQGRANPPAAAHEDQPLGTGFRVFPGASERAGSKCGS